jgi:hypothetical protein
MIGIPVDGFWETGRLRTLTLLTLALGVLWLQYVAY